MPYDQGGNWAPGIMYDQGGNPYCDQPPDDWNSQPRRRPDVARKCVGHELTPDALAEAALRREDVSPNGAAESS